MNEALQRYLDTSPILRAAAEGDMREQMAARRKADAEAPFEIHQAIEQAPPQKRVKALEAYAASTLYGVHLERPPLIIQGIIPAGLSVLAGAPKRGKSWLALAMGISVSTGAPFLGIYAAAEAEHQAFLEQWNEDRRKWEAEREARRRELEDHPYAQTHDAIDNILNCQGWRIAGWNGGLPKE